MHNYKLKNSLKSQVQAPMVKVLFYQIENSVHSFTEQNVDWEQTFNFMFLINLNIQTARVTINDINSEYYVNPYPPFKHLEDYWIYYNQLRNKYKAYKIIK